MTVSEPCPARQSGRSTGKEAHDPYPRFVEVMNSRDRPDHNNAALTSAAYQYLCYSITACHHGRSGVVPGMWTQPHPGEGRHRGSNGRGGPVVWGPDRGTSGVDQ